MRLTAHSDYAIRMLIFIALRDGGRATIREVAESYGISRNHLMKVAHELQRSGLVDSTRGKGGGLQLARPASEIGLGDVVRCMEPDLQLAECFGACNRCVITPSCTLRGVLSDALDAFMSVLDGYTLADITEPRAQKLRQHLGLSLEGLP